MKNELEETEHSVINKDNTTATSNSTVLTIGMILDGTYEIRREIARGGMGIVYEAYHKFFNKKVAIKIILSITIDSLQLKRFQKEIEACANLSHPNIIHIYNAGIYENKLYIVMDYIDGVNICEYVAQHDPNYGKEKLYKTGLGIKRDWKLCAQLIYKTALALEYIHKQKMLHRDIKPSNILVRSDGTPIIIDLGLVKFQSEKVESLTKSGELLGTVQYMPIEQAQGKHGKVDARSDIYSLGLVLYELLTEEMAYSGTSLMEICYNIMSYNPPLPREINPQIPEALEEITIHATEKKKEKRYATAQEFADALKKYLYDENVQETKKYDDYQKQVRLQQIKKRIVKYCIALVIVIITTISIITSGKKTEQQINQLKQEISQSEHEINEKQEQYNKLMEDITRKRNELSDYRKEYIELKRQINDLSRDIDEKQNQLSDYNKECDELKKQITNFTPQPEIEKLSESIEKLKEERQAVEAQLNALKESKEVWDKNKHLLPTIERDINNFEDEIERAKNNKVVKERELSSMESECQSLINYIKDRSDEIESIQQYIQRSDQEIRELKNQIRNIHLKDNNQERRRMRQNEILESNIQDIRKSQNEEKKRKIKLENDKNQKIQKLSTVKTQISNSKSTIKDLDKKIKKLERDLKNKKLQCQNLERRKDEAQNFEQTQKKLEQITQTIESLSKTVNEETRKKRTLKEVKDNLSTLEEKCNLLKQKIKDKETEIQQLKDNLSTKETKIQQLKNQ